MAYQKKKIPREVRRLKKRLARFKEIVEQSEMDDPELLQAGLEQVKVVQETINHYNEALRRADELRDSIEKQKRIAQDIHERIRLQVIGLFGRDSLEYQRLGGVRKSEIDYNRKNDDQ